MEVRVILFKVNVEVDSIKVVFDVEVVVFLKFKNEMLNDSVVGFLLYFGVWLIVESNSIVNVVINVLVKIKYIYV